MPHSVLIVTEGGGTELVRTTVIQSVSRDASLRDAKGYVPTASHISIVHPMAYQMAFMLENHVHHLPITNDVRKRISEVNKLVRQVVDLTSGSYDLPQATVISLQRYTS